MTVPNIAPAPRADDDKRSSGRGGSAAQNGTAPTPPGIDLVDAHEREVLGAMLVSTDAIEAVTDLGISSIDYRNPLHGTIHAAIVAAWNTDQPTTALAVATILDESGDLRRIPGGAVYLAQLMEDCASPAFAGWHAARIVRYAAARAAAEKAAKLGYAAARVDVDNIGDLWNQGRELFAGDPLARLAQAGGGTPIDKFLAAGSEDEPHDWLIPGLLERGDRVILTGQEGGGKSTLGRQLAVRSASGRHIFTGEIIDPIRVLIVDLENSEPQLRRELRPLFIKANQGGEWDPNNLRIEVRLQGLDLHSAEDRAWLDSTVAAARPDLVITGPLYKMASGDPNEEKHAKGVVDALDRIRAKYGCALWLEAHTPKNPPAGSKQRSTTPYGASLWLRWPEFGVHVSIDGDVTHWRGQREFRDWPTLLIRGGQWPWTPAENDLDIKFRRIKNARFSSGRPLTVRELVDITGLSRSAIGRVIKHFQIEWDQFNKRNPTEDDIS